MLHQKLKELRESRGVRRSFVAHKLGVTSSAVHYWETGHRGISGANVARLIEIYRAADAEIVALFRG